ncbi:MAG: hypothetical protein WKG03_00665 [Telluria sp.]
MTTLYKAVTPFGAFQATWGEDEDSRVEYTGNAAAIAYFRDYLGLNSISGLGGALIQFDTLEPAELYGFCQSEQHGISVIPTEDDLMDELESDEMNVTPLMDAVSPAEVFELIGEGAQLLSRMDENADTFFDDLDRLRYIVTELGDDAPPVDERNADARAYMQSVVVGSVNLSDLAVADELGKIHEAHAADPDMLALFKSSVKAYADYAIARANEALAKG